MVNFFAQGDTRMASRNTRIQQEGVASSSTVSPASKKPVQSEQLTSSQLQHSDFPYLRAAIANQIDKVSVLPPNQQNWPEYERLRTLARRLRKAAGFSPWLPLGFALGVCGLVVALLLLHKPTGYVYSAPQTYWRVREQINDYDFVMQRVDRGVAQMPWTMHFCHDYKPLFEPGMTLSWFAYDDRGDCASVAPADRGYVIVRGPDHRPVISQFK